MSVAYSFLKNHLKVCISVYSCSKKNCLGHFSEHNNDTSYKRINCLLMFRESLKLGGGAVFQEGS